MVDVHNVIRCEVPVQTRSKFFKTLSRIGLVLLGAQTAGSDEFARPGVRRASYSIPQRYGREFRLGNDGTKRHSDAIDCADGVESRAGVAHRLLGPSRLSCRLPESEGLPQMGAACGLFCNYDGIPERGRTS